VTFFPKLISGPIVRYQEMESQLQSRKMAPAKLGAGVNLFLVGLFKKVLLADNLGTGFAAISGLTTMSVGTAWLGMVLYSLQLYFDFSGYSDMAIGLAKMFGFSFEKNFDYPYLSTSITEFWRRWHISLGRWFREYVYIPLGGNRCSRPKQLRNLAVVWLLTGLWHGASWTFILWGIYHGAFVILEKFVIRGRTDKLPKALRVLPCCLIVFLGWVLFFSPNLGSALHYYGQMFGKGGLGLVDSVCKYYLSSNILLLLAAVLGCGPWVQRLHQRLYALHGKATLGLSVGLYVVLLVLTVAYLVSATYTSFLYFQF
jgi:alginate O-acetyltransferase complex protein AlgI